MNKHKLRITELILIFIIGMITLISFFPFVNSTVPLLGIPFVIIIGMRSVFMIYEDAKSEESA